MIGWQTIFHCHIQLTLVAVLPNGDTESLDGWVWAWDNLSAEENVYGWRVVDIEGGVWYPSMSTNAEIEAAHDPATEAVRICREEPFRGVWYA